MSPSLLQSQKPVSVLFKSSPKPKKSKSADHSEVDVLRKQVQELQAAQEKMLQDQTILKEELEEKNKKILLLQDETMVHYA